MANRIIDNVYILDTGSANVLIPWPNTAKVMGIGLTGTEVRISGADTTNVLVRLTSNEYRYLGGVNFGPDIKLPVLTAGTAWVYFA